MRDGGIAKSQLKDKNILVTCAKKGRTGPCKPDPVRNPEGLAAVIPLTGIAASAQPKLGATNPESYRRRRSEDGAGQAARFSCSVLHRAGFFVPRASRTGR